MVIVKKISIQDSFDLHSFLPRDVPGVLSEYLEEARKRGWREVRIIHGKGKGVRRAQVVRFLSGHSLVAQFFDAPPDRGGSGATIVLLEP
jgi:DNA-nicking Smr family endonuclease